MKQDSLHPYTFTGRNRPSFSVQRVQSGTAQHTVHNGAFVPKTSIITLSFVILSSFSAF